MLVIRQQQMAAFSQYMRINFIQRMITHLRQSFPEKTVSSDDQQLREIIEQGIIISEKYDITKECDVGRYLDLMFLLSFDFDRQVDWARSILRKKWVASVKLDVLHAQYQETQRGGKYV